jgi:hypothetical protein
MPHLFHLAVAVLALAVEEVVRTRTHVRLPPLGYLLQAVHYDEAHVFEFGRGESAAPVDAWGLVLARTWNFVFEVDLYFCGETRFNCKVAAFD